MTQTRRYLADHLIPMEAEGLIHSPGVVDVADGKVVWAGRAEEAPDLAEVTTERVEGVLLPGMVNVHCHTPMVLLRGAGENLPVDRWLHEVMWPREARLTPEDVEVGMAAGAAELLAGGVTTSLEMYFYGEAVAAWAAWAGLRCVVTAPLIEDAKLSGLFGSLQQQLDEMTELMKRWSESALIQVGIGPHAVYSISEECLRSVAEAAAANGALVHIHVDEQAWEVGAVREQTGMSATAFLKEVAILDSPTMAAHSVWISPEDIDILAESGAGVAHCPSSNGKHASGIAPVAEMRAAGIPVGIATDGPASHHRLDMFEEMRMAMRLARIRSQDAAALLPHEALAMVTREAADAIRRPDLGRLAPGNPADMIAVSLTDPAFGPVIPEEDDLISRLVWSGSPAAVHSSWVEGRQVMAEGEVLTVDVEAVARAVTGRARSLAG
ncbi:MAG: amidohydrolase family protein [Acidimicrobiia bacterium]|nr:amidohydrolase family protein [Acidimicrobiia bacterium]